VVNTLYDTTINNGIPWGKFFTANRFFSTFGTAFIVFTDHFLLLHDSGESIFRRGGGILQHM
jgi:hypothetical protein